jgi:transposase
MDDRLRRSWWEATQTFIRWPKLRRIGAAAPARAGASWLRARHGAATLLPRLDGTVIRAHHKAAGGCAIGFLLIPGQDAKLPQAGKLLAFLPGTPVWMVADHSYSSHDLQMAIRNLGSKPAIPTRRNEAKVTCRDWLDVNRERVERLRGRLKEWRAVATRYEKTAAAYVGV